MKLFSQQIIVAEEHIDFNQHVNNLVYLQWALDISREHWLNAVSDDIAKKYFWVVKSHHIEYKKQAFAGDKVRITTYVESVRGPFSERIVEIYRGEDLLVIVNSNWCFLHRASQNIKRIPEEVQRLFI